MAKTDSDQLHPMVAALARDFDLVDGRWAVADERLLEHHHQLQACAVELRPKLVTDLVVLAARFEREAADSARTALVQLLALAAGLLGDVQDAERAFAEGGVRSAAARKLIGADGVQFEKGGQPRPGQAAASLLGVLKGNK